MSEVLVVCLSTTCTGPACPEIAAAASPGMRIDGGVGAKVDLTARWALGLDVKNLLDRRIEWVALDPPPRPDLAQVPKSISDLAGFPLPGRTFYLRVDLRY